MGIPAHAMFCSRLSARFHASKVPCRAVSKIGVTQGRGRLDIQNECALLIKDAEAPPVLEADPQQIDYHPTTERLPYCII